MNLDKMLCVGIDCGGTNIRIYEVNPETGELLDNLIREKILIKGFDKNEELIDYVSDSINKFGKGRKLNIGTCVAGVFDEDALIVLDFTNSNIKGDVTFARDLRDMGHNVGMTGDVTATAVGQAIFGHGKGIENVVSATYSTGFNVAKTVSGKLLFGVNPEFGHQDYVLESRGFRNLPCGCDGTGHLETYVSASGATLMAQKYLINTPSFSHNHLVNVALRRFNEDNQTEHSSNDLINDLELRGKVLKVINAKDVYEAYRNDNKCFLFNAIRETQIEAVACSFGRMLAAYNPVDLIIPFGSQAEKERKSLMNPAIKRFQSDPGKYYHPALKSPEIIINEFAEMGTKGAVAYLLQKNC